jgi:hypothetical protein
LLPSSCFRSTFSGITNKFETIQGLKDTVEIPADVAEIAADATFSVIIYEDAGFFIQNDSTPDTVSTKVISVTIDGVESGQTLDQPVTFFFSRSSDVDAAFTCVYWDFTSSSWESDGCWLEEEMSNSTHIACSCVHLTNFAVLADSGGGTGGLSSADAQALELITYIGCSISIFCLLIVVIVFMYFSV